METDNDDHGFFFELRHINNDGSDWPGLSWVARARAPLRTCNTQVGSPPEKDVSPPNCLDTLGAITMAGMAPSPWLARLAVSTEAGF